MAQRDLPQNGSERLDSIPALLARNVARNGALPAYREKEFGIWQSWTWAQAADEIQALALGFLSLGLARGDYVAVIGRNRPMHYWSMIAAQMCGAIPVPLYQDANADEMAYVLDHCGARFVICGDQEQVDKVIEVQDRIHHIDQVVYVDKRGMRKYDHSRMNALADVVAEGKAAHNRFDAELDARIMQAANAAAHAGSSAPRRIAANGSSAAGSSTLVPIITSTCGRQSRRWITSRSARW